MDRIIEDYQAAYGIDDAQSFYDTENPDGGEPDALYEAIQLYNASSMGYEDPYHSMREIEGIPTLFGYIEIPAMELQLPLYIGASSQHLDLGAAVLERSSVPIGGRDTNAVIAAHRGWSRGDYFLDIEKLNAGDKIYIHNPWEVLVYEVSHTAIVEPDDIDAVQIVAGQDMITLLTCHPYLSNGRYRYLVYCLREGSLSPEASQIMNSETGSTLDEVSIPEDSISARISEMEDRFRTLCKWVLTGVIMLLGLVKIKKK